MRQIILASISPRRRQLFKLLGLKFKVADSKYKEVMRQDLSHEQLVKVLALGKAHSAAKRFPKAIIVAADIIVSFQGKAIGKPKSVKDAKNMLSNFSGKTHTDVTGVVVLDAASKQIISFINKTKITFKKLSKQSILDYIATGECFGKAGGYNLQGAGFNLIAKIDGDFTNGLGLAHDRGM